MITLLEASHRWPLMRLSILIRLLHLVKMLLISWLKLRLGSSVSPKNFGVFSYSMVFPLYSSFILSGSRFLLCWTRRLLVLPMLSLVRHFLVHASISCSFVCSLVPMCFGLTALDQMVTSSAEADSDESAWLSNAVEVVVEEYRAENAPLRNSSLHGYRRRE